MLIVLLLVGACVFALVRACGCARARAGRGNANNGLANCEAPNLALAVIGYATLHYSKKKKERKKKKREHTCTYTHTHRPTLTWACAHALSAHSNDGEMLVSF